MVWKLLLSLVQILVTTGKKYLIWWHTVTPSAWWKARYWNWMADWTVTGRKIQSLSGACPGSVQALSNKRSFIESDQSLSRLGPESVMLMLICKAGGQTLDIRHDKLWTLLGLLCFQIKILFRQGLDNLCNWTNLWKVCKDCPYLSVVQYLSTKTIEVDQFWSRKQKMQTFQRFVQLQRLSKPCLNNILIWKHKIRTLTTVFTNPSNVHSLSCLKNLTSSACLDSRWTNSGFWCPWSVHLFWKSALAWPTLDPAWTAIGLTLYKNSYWTGPGQTLDRRWTVIGFCVHSLSRQPFSSSTKS